MIGEDELKNFINITTFIVPTYNIRKRIIVKTWNLKHNSKNQKKRKFSASKTDNKNIEYGEENRGGRGAGIKRKKYGIKFEMLPVMR